MNFSDLIPFREKDFNAYQDPFKFFREEFQKFLNRDLGENESIKSFDVDIYDQEKEIILEADLPGIADKDVKINLSHQVLTIQCEKKNEKSVEKQHLYIKERRQGTFLRSFRLPFSVPSDKIEAELKNGTLTIKIPKPDEAIEKVENIPLKKTSI